MASRELGSPLDRCFDFEELDELDLELEPVNIFEILLMFVLGS